MRICFLGSLNIFLNSSGWKKDPRWLLDHQARAHSHPGHVHGQVKMNTLDKTTLKEQFEIVWHPRDDRRPMRRSPPPRRGRSPSPYGRRRSPSFRRGRSPRWILKCFHHLKPVGVYKDIFHFIYHRWQYLNLASFPPAPEGTEDLQVPAGEEVQAPDTGDKYTSWAWPCSFMHHIQEESLATLQEALPLA